MTARKAAASLLVGDIGGTHTRLALYELEGKLALAEAAFASRDYATFDEIALAFLAGAGDAPHPVGVVLGVAGPVSRGTANITNLPWQLEERALGRKLLVPSVALVNDLVATAVGCLHTPPRKLLPLTPKRPSPKGQNIAVIAAGTGLGEAGLVWDGARHVAYGTEGGHTDFAPRSDIEVDLLRFLLARHPDHVSYERIVSGDGLGALYDFFASRGPRTPRAIEKRLAEGDRNAAIAEIGLAREHRPAASAVDLFASIYGAEAGNLALKQLALGGVYVAGNIAKQIIPERSELFLEGFRQKGRFSAMLHKVPIAVVDDPMVGVRGALAIARERAAAQESAPARPRGR